MSDAPRGTPPAAATAAAHGDAADDDEDSGYSLDHLSAVIRPVALTMVLASIAVSKIREPSIDAGISGGLSAYLVYNPGSGAGGAGGGGGESTGDLVGQAIVNAVVIVCVIAGATFVLVACYYFRLLKLMVAYLIFASMNLLGYSGGFMAVTAISVWKLPVDWATLGFIMWNFAVGGVVAVFWQKGVPRAVTQGYLVAVSVIMAWILTKLPEWTSWALLVALAVYDLCAVLTPCGPLKWLVELAQVRKDPIPGLLYEANVGGGGGDGGVRDTLTSGAQRSRPPQQPAAAAAAARGPEPQPPDAQRRMMQLVRQQQQQQQQQARSSAASGSGDVETGSASDVDATAAAVTAAAEVPDWRPPSSRRNSARSVGDATQLSARSVTGQRRAPSAASAAGGSDDSHSRTEPLVAASYASSDGDADGSAGEEPSDKPLEVAPEEDASDRSIKLGLGDFVFYSVLVSRAALFDISTFAATFVAVILGLGGTLFLLGIFKMALPALPISIFLGVALYFVTRLAITPMLVEMSLNGVGL